jgi:hypothetical protein
MYVLNNIDPSILMMITNLLSQDSCMQSRDLSLSIMQCARVRLSGISERTLIYPVTFYIRTKTRILQDLTPCRLPQNLLDGSEMISL